MLKRRFLLIVSFFCLLLALVKDVQGSEFGIGEIENQIYGTNQYKSPGENKKFNFCDSFEKIISDKTSRDIKCLQNARKYNGGKFWEYFYGTGWLGRRSCLLYSAAGVVAGIYSKCSDTRKGSFFFRDLMTSKPFIGICAVSTLIGCIPKLVFNKDNNEYEGKLRVRAHIPKLERFMSEYMDYDKASISLNEHASQNYNLIDEFVNKNITKERQNEFYFIKDGEVVSPSNELKRNHNDENIMLAQKEKIEKNEDEYCKKIKAFSRDFARNYKKAYLKKANLYIEKDQHGLALNKEMNSQALIKELMEDPKKNMSIWKQLLWYYPFKW
jgi:hypothetical protein